MIAPDFTGRWRFDAEQSRLQIALPDAVELTIEQEDPRFRLERMLVFGDRRDQFAIGLEIGAEARPVTRHGATLHPSLQWDGETLVFRTLIDAGDGQATNVVRYSLQEGGGQLVADEEFTGPGQYYVNRWVFRRI
jgi:hypothetical protein